MYLDDALQHFSSKAALARALGISKQAVGQWPKDQPIPEIHQLKLKYEILPAMQNPQKEESAA